jgi:O-antigen/teichoic acid export membrane protein
VNLIVRLLLTLPFVFVTFLYLRGQLSDNGCWGLIELVYTVAFWIFLALTFIVSISATLRKRQSQKIKAEPYSLIITLLTLLALIIAGLWGDNLKGAKWIEQTQNGM